MKFLYPLIALCLSISSFSQNSQVGYNKNQIDANGFAKSQDKQTSRDTNFAPRSTQAISFDYEDTRALSEINGLDTGEGYPWISSDGLRLYYCSGSGGEQNRLYYTERANDDSLFQTPILVPIDVVAPLSIWLSENELQAYVTTFTDSASKLFYYQREAITDSFNNPEEIFLNGISLGFISAASLNLAQNELFLFSADYGVLTFNRTSSNSFDYVGPLLSASNTKPGQLSKDDFTYFVAIENIIPSTSLYQLERSNTENAFNGSTLQEISSLNNPSQWNNQPTMSGNLEWVVFVRNIDTEHLWHGNELFMSHRQALSTQNNDFTNNFALFPNPSSGKFNITFGTSLNTEDYNLAIYDATGKLLFEKLLATEIDLTNYRAGIYFAKISGETFIEVHKIIRN